MATVSTKTLRVRRQSYASKACTLSTLASSEPCLSVLVPIRISAAAESVNKAMSPLCRITNLSRLVLDDQMTKSATQNGSGQKFPSYGIQAHVQRCDKLR